ncbi:MAG: DUF937 domain-containing protein [Pigmentiphaga sp.]|nr:DUF937 domain-containing protein [Pigmentiphaga sp.]
MQARPSLSDELLADIDRSSLSQLSQQLGASESQTREAVGAALPMLLGTLGHNAGQINGAQSLFNALQKDHAQPGMDLGALLSAVVRGSNASAAQTDGANILGHIFGNRQQEAQSSLGQATGLGSDGAAKLLQMLAPLVMAFLAKQISAGGMDAGALGQTLGREAAQTRQQGGLAGGLLGSLLDQDGDGKLGLNDLMKLGGSLLSKRR